MLPVLIVAGFISLLKIPFDIATVMIASVAFGLCIDDIVHFMHKYTSVNKSLSIKDKIQATLVELSPAIIITSLVFIGGFITLALSDLVILQKFGVFTSLAIFLATLATLILLPAFFLLFDKKQEERGL
jgi:predicted RND superfamily exporter protein